MAIIYLQDINVGGIFYNLAIIYCNIKRGDKLENKMDEIKYLLTFSVSV